MKHKIVIAILFSLFAFYTQAQNIAIVVKGKLVDKKNKAAIGDAQVKISNSNYSTFTNTNGEFEFLMPRVKHLNIVFSKDDYKKQIKDINVQNYEDTISILVYLESKIIDLEGVIVSSTPKPDTVFGTNKFSILDFDFYDNEKYILLTEDRKTNKHAVRLVDWAQTTLSTFYIPKEAGEVKELYHDFIGFTNVICKEAIYRIIIDNDKIRLGQLPMEDYQTMVMPIIDTVKGKLLFTNYDKDFPQFNYYWYDTKDSTKKLITSIEDKELMGTYRFEYYHLKFTDKVLAKNIAAEYNIDKFKAAALISGFTSSLFYTPLYSPLYVIGDTLCVFDHYKNLLFHMDRNGNKIDSIDISYHHPKNWKEWKNMMFKDVVTNEVYAQYDKNGHKYLKQISYRNGKELGTYNIIHHSAQRIKIKDGFIYYVYRPFESLQEKFLYKERIILGN